MNARTIVGTGGRRTVTIAMLYVGVLVVLQTGMLGRIRDTVRQLSGTA